MEQGNRNKGQHRHRYRGSDRQGEAENYRQKRFIMTLAKAQVGDRLWIAGYESKEGINRLVGMGLAPGMAVEFGWQLTHCDRGNSHWYRWRDGKANSGIRSTL
jgi:hypothetical protein